MNNKLWIFLLILASAIAMISVSCKTRKLIKEPIKDEGPEYIFKKLKENELKFTDLSLRFDTEIIIDKKSNSFKGNIKIRKDSLIWISINPLFGIEAFRLLFTPDSVKMLNKLNNTYFTGDYSMVNTMFSTPFDLDMIQALLTGIDFSYYENDIFKAGIDGGLYKLTTIGRRKLKKYVRNQQDNDKILVQDIWLDPQSFKIRRQSWKEIKNNNSKMLFSYDSFTAADDGQLFPSLLICDIIAENNISLKTTFSKIQVNKPFDFNFNIPANYKQIQ
jgi:hypothetical protein